MLKKMQRGQTVVPGWVLMDFDKKGLFQIHIPSLIKQDINDLVTELQDDLRFFDNTNTLHIYTTTPGLWSRQAGVLEQIKAELKLAGVVINAIGVQPPTNPASFKPQQVYILVFVKPVKIDWLEVVMDCIDMGGCTMRQPEMMELSQAVRQRKPEKTLERLELTVIEPHLFAKMLDALEFTQLGKHIAGFALRTL
jgi:hypothetical protein